MTSKKPNTKKKNKYREKKFKVTIRSSDESEEEKRKRLFEVFDLLLNKGDKK